MPRPTSAGASRRACSHAGAADDQLASKDRVKRLRLDRRAKLGGDLLRRGVSLLGTEPTL